MCYDHIFEDCTMTGELVLEVVDVIDAHFCQEDLRNIGEIFGAQVQQLKIFFISFDKHKKLKLIRVCFDNF